MSLTYDVAKERLYGYVGKQHFDMHAASGGGRGRTTGEVDSSMSSHLSTTQEDKTLQRRGGCLPGGVYVCEYRANHPHFHQCIHLKLVTPAKQLTLTKVCGHRGLDSFYIHGQGPQGSDGCIVPVNEKAQRARLNEAVKHHPGTELRVINAIYGLPAMIGTSLIPENIA
jgi:hypothetical protein